MRSGSRGRPGRQPMSDKREHYTRLIRQGVSNSEACRQLGIDRKTGHWWKNCGSFTRNGVTRLVEPIVNRVLGRAESGRYLSEDERVKIADGVYAGKSPQSIAHRARPGQVDGVPRAATKRVRDGYLPHAAQAMMRARRPRPKERLLERDVELRGLVQGCLDQRWSPEHVVHELEVIHGRRVAVETIYQALYSPQRVIQREPAKVLRTGRPHRRPRRRGDGRRPRFVVPITLSDERSAEADDRRVAGHGESQCCCQVA